MLYDTWSFLIRNVMKSQEIDRKKKMPRKDLYHFLRGSTRLKLLKSKMHVWHNYLVAKEGKDKKVIPLIHVYHGRNKKKGMHIKTYRCNKYLWLQKKRWVDT